MVSQRVQALPRVEVCCFFGPHKIHPMAYSLYDSRQIGLVDFDFSCPYSKVFGRNLTKAQRARTTAALSCCGLGLLASRSSGFYAFPPVAKDCASSGRMLTSVSAPNRRSPASGFRLGRNGILGIDVPPIADGSPGPMPGAGMSHLPRR